MFHRPSEAGTFKIIKRSQPKNNGAATGFRGPAMPAERWYEVKEVAAFERFERGVERRPELPRMLDAVRRLPPPVDPVKASTAAGLPEKRGVSYFKWLISAGVRLTADYSHSAIGLSLLLVKYGRIVDRPPKREWVFKHVHTSQGSITIYRYPREAGHEFIVKEVSKVGGDVVTYRFEELFFPRPSFEYYWIGEFPSPPKALKMLKDHPRFFIMDYPVERKPPNQAVLYILSVLERDATVKDTDLARGRWRSRHPRRKILKHLQLMVERGILRGTMVEIPYPTATRAMLVIRSGSRSRARRVAEQLSKYLYSLEVGVGYDTTFVTLALSEKHVPPLIRYLESMLDSRCVDSIVFDTSNVVEVYSIPYMNYDPISRSWVVDAGRWR